MKATLICLGIRGFNPKRKNAAKRLEGLRTPEGAAIPPNTLAGLRRDMSRRRLVSDQIRRIEEARLERLEHAPCDGRHAMVRLLVRVTGVGIGTADMLVHEVLSRNMRDRRAIARYAGLTGSPDESGRRRRENGLSRSGNARVRRGMIQLAWRCLIFQKASALPQWFRARTENAGGASQDNDRCRGAQASDCSVAVRPGGHCAREHRSASRTHERRIVKAPASLGPLRAGRR
jgi:transposase